MARDAPLPPATSGGSQPGGDPGEAEPGVDIFALLVDRVQEYAIFLLDPGGRIASWNAGAERVKGYTAEEAIGRSFEMFYPPEDRAAGKPRRLLAQALREGRVEDEGWRVRRDGTRFWADVVITALHDDRGRLRGFAKVTRDLTERRAAEEALRQSEERLRLLVEGVKDYAIFSLDPDGRILSWNAGAERTKGYRAAEVLGRSFEMFYPPEDRAAGKPRRLLAEALREGRVEDEGWRVRQDGTRFWADAIITPVFGPGGEHRGFAKVTRDLTERRKAEEMRAANERLREMARLKSQFINTVSHELRTPLTPVMLQMEVLRGQRSDWTPLERNAFDILARNLRRLALLVEDVLDVGRLETGRLSLVAGPMDMVAAAREAVESFRAAAAEKDVRVALDGPDEAGLVADVRRVGQVLDSLLSNAVRHTPGGGEVRVRVERQAAGVRVEVHDTGRGLTPGQVARLFHPFVRVHDAEAGPGTGLGLYIARGLVEAHGGRIWADSPGPGRGATFTFTLPAAPALPAPPAAGPGGTASL